MTPSDLHALGTPPALILSQDQTLHQCSPPKRHVRFVWWPRTKRSCSCCCACSSRSVRALASRKKLFASGPLAPSLAHDEPRLRLRYRNPVPRLRASLSTCSPSSRANIRLRRRRLLLRHHPRPPVPLRGSLFSEPAEPTAPLAPLSRGCGRGVCHLRDLVPRRLDCTRFPWAPEAVSGPSRRTPLLYHARITMSSEPPDSESGPAAPSGVRASGT